MGLLPSLPKETIFLRNTHEIRQGESKDKINVLINVLVVCSLLPHKRRPSTDYGDRYKEIFSYFYPQDNKQINVKFVEEIDLKSRFPYAVMDEKYINFFDMIWFAGCNSSDSIFLTNEICLNRLRSICNEKFSYTTIVCKDAQQKSPDGEMSFSNPQDFIKTTYNILKEDTGVLIFTEGRSNHKFDTMKIQNMSVNDLNKNKQEQISTIFEEYFEEIPTKDEVISYKKKKIYLILKIVI